MADRSIVVRLRAEVDGFTRAMGDATKAAEQTAKGTEDAAKRADTSLGRMVQSAQNNRQAWETTGRTLTAFGAASLGALGLATKAAMDWESSWAGVQKTVDGTAPQMAALEQGLRGLARELPSSHAEIAAVAEAAGQLGIETPNVLGFTRTMIDMGEATNMSAEEAATSLARFMNVMGTSQADVGRLGASVVGLGNNFATTESEIVQMSQRLSGAGAQAGLTEGDVMGMAAAMSSVGIEAQAGGSAMSQTMKRIGKAVDEGGESLSLFAEVSGMSAEQFSAAWKSDPAMALDAFTNGLSGVESQGMTTNGVLAELGITGIRESDALLRLSAASEQGADGMSLLAEAVQMGNEEFDKGSALIEEASKRYETAESRISMAKNALVDAGISIGGVVLPAFADLADSVADVAGWFAGLPAPVHGVTAALGGIAGVGSLAAGTFLLLFPRVLDTVQAFKTLNRDMPGVATGLGKVGRAVGIATAAFVGLQIAGAVVDHFREVETSADGIAAGLLNVAANGDITKDSLDELFSATGTGNAEVRDLAQALDILDAGPAAQTFDFLASGLGVFDTQTEVAKRRLAELDQALSMLYTTGHGEKVAETLNASGVAVEDLIERMPSLQAHLTDVATAMGLEADAATLAKIATGELSPVVDEATGAVTGFEEGMDGAAEATQSVAEAAQEAITAMSDLAGEFITAERAAMDYADALDETNDLVKENGKAWEDGTEAGDENKRMLLDLADQAWATADALSAEGKSGTFLEGAREDLIDVATEMIGSREEAEKYVDQLLGTPAEIETIVKLEADAAREEWDALWDELGYHPPLVIDPEVDPDDKVPQFTGLIDSIPPETNTDVNANTEGGEGRVLGFGEVLEQNTEDKTTNVGADVEPAIWEVNRFNTVVDEAGGTVEINGETLPADQALSTLMGIVNNSDGTVTIDGMTIPADRALATVIGIINGSDGTVTIDGNNNPANSATDSAVGHANRSSGTIRVGANTGSAERGINHAARTRYSTISVSYSVRGGVPTMNVGNRTATARAMGGPVFGPGSGTSDSIPALLSNGEHVITAKEVAMAGGQDAIYKMREAIRSGFRFANGGAVGGSAGAVQAIPHMQAQARSSGPVFAQVDQAGIESAMVRGLSSATVIAQVSDRVAANLVKRGTAHNGRAGG